jgi:hypothetical protein
MQSVYWTCQLALALQRSAAMAMQQSATSGAPPPARVQRARQLFLEFYAACFWHLKPDLNITEETIPAILHGLRRHGGRRGVLAAAALEEMEETGT